MPYSIEFLADLDRTISRARLSRYLTATAGNIDQALQLYEKNILLAEALFGFLHGLEIAVRNTLHTAMSDDLGIKDWYQHLQPLPWPAPAPQELEFTRAMQNMISEARNKAGSPAAVGKVIAELPFGFWTLLISNRYEALWRLSLYKAFPHARSRRQIIHWRLDAIRFLRNRIAHHEPIISSGRGVYTGLRGQPTITLPSMLESVAWISPAAAEWLRTSTRYEAAHTLLEEVANSGVQL